MPCFDEAVLRSAEEGEEPPMRRGTRRPRVDALDEAEAMGDLAEALRLGSMGAFAGMDVHRVLLSMDEPSELALVRARGTRQWAHGNGAEEACSMTR